MISSKPSNESGNWNRPRVGCYYYDYDLNILRLLPPCVIIDHARLGASAITIDTSVTSCLCDFSLSEYGDTIYDVFRPVPRKDKYYYY